MSEPLRRLHGPGAERVEGGWRLRASKSNEPLPLVSIITSTLEAARYLPYTLASVAAQQGELFEWIVIDGGSSDGTVELLRRHNDLIAHWLSEPDRGIYDAWNKGCSLARGQWLLFLGAGDEFAAPDSLAKVAERLADVHPDYDLVYGKLIYVSKVGRQDLEQIGVPWRELQGGWELCRPALPPHPATFHHRSLFVGAPPFDTRFRIVGDTHFLLRHVLRKPPLFVPIAVCRAPIGGVSMSPGTALALAREIREMNRDLGIVPPVGHRLTENLLLAAKIVVSCMPLPIGQRIADLYRRMTGRVERWNVR